MTADLGTKTSIDNITQIKPLIAQKELRCRGCSGNLSRIKRGPFVKALLFWLPLKHYICYRCSRKTYRLDKTGR
jgi:DNA-directed RNA polymerase subunit RPC12/RpoP